MGSLIGLLAAVICIFYIATANLPLYIVSSALASVFGVVTVVGVWKYAHRPDVVEYLAHGLILAATLILWVSNWPTGLFTMLEDGRNSGLGAVLCMIPIPIAAFIFRSPRAVLAHGALFIVLLWTLCLSYSGPIPRDGTIESSIFLTLSAIFQSVCFAYFGSVAVSLTEAQTEMRGELNTAVRHADIERKANAAKTRFVSVMSHEIRNPLQAIILHSENLEQDGSLTFTQLDSVKGISRASQLLLSITNDVLDVTKIESGAVSLENVPFQLRETVEFCLQTVAPQAQRKGIELILTADPVLPVRVLGDPTRVRQVLHNLLSNAIKFTETGEVEVTMAIEADEGEQGAAWTDKGGDDAAESTETSASSGAPGDAASAVNYLSYHLSVRDTGIGINEDGISKLFREFSQVDETTTREYGGTGLGLFICRQLAELMGGTVWVESVVGKGSTFHFRVRLEADVPPPAPPGNPVPMASAMADAVTLDRSDATFHVVLAVPNERLRTSLEAIVRAFCGDGVELSVLSATNASGALDRLQRLSEKVRGTSIHTTCVLAVIDVDILTNSLTRELSSDAMSGVIPIVLTPDPSAKQRKVLAKDGLRDIIGKPLGLVSTCNVLSQVITRWATMPRARPTKGAEVKVTADLIDDFMSVSTDSPSSTLLRKKATLHELDSAAATPRPTPTSPEGRPAVLIVDDFIMVRDLVERVVSSSFGFRTYVAHNGAEAVEIVKTSYGDVGMVLMDCEMPIMDGFTATKEIRKYEAGLPAAPAQPLFVCAMTANAMRDDVKRCYEIGMSGFLSKPVRRADLASVLETNVRATPVAAVSPRQPPSRTSSPSPLTTSRSSKKKKRSKARVDDMV
jgi:signal transduction histidine kinase/CheY-like chemotaxis protein